MTYEEAKDMCFDGYTLYDNRDYYAIPDEWFDVVDKALEKQMPKKPIQHGKSGDDDCWFECPVCTEYITGYFECDDNYCVNCGQAIDWSEE